MEIEVKMEAREWRWEQEWGREGGGRVERCKGKSKETRLGRTNKRVKAGEGRRRVERRKGKHAGYRGRQGRKRKWIQKTAGCVGRKGQAWDESKVRAGTWE